MRSFLTIWREKGVGNGFFWSEGDLLRENLRIFFGEIGNERFEGIWKMFNFEANC